MSLPKSQREEVEHWMTEFLNSRRPPERIRNEVDLCYKIENQSVIIYEMRRLMDSTQKIESPVAKTTFVKAQQLWKVYWMRGNLNWHLYEPAEVKSFSQFTKLVDADSKGCFFG
jgi:hypothetical protein